MELKGRIAIVTGGAQGLGVASAERLAEEGASVVIADINEAGAKAAAMRLGNDSYGVRCDISRQADIVSLVDDVSKRFGRIDILINNAGIAENVDMLDMTEEQYDRMLSINLKGMVFLSRTVLRGMMERRYGRIVSMTSVAGERGSTFTGIHYASAKAGIIAATKCIAVKGGAYGVTANAVAPGYIDTELAKKLKFDLESIPMKRLGTAREVADAVEFLASDRASYITGITLDINGGVYIR